MKKKVSLFIVFTILIGMLPNTVLFGSAQLRQTINFIKYNRSLDKIRDGYGLEERAPSQEETSLRWNIQENGIYRLTYYTGDVNTTNKVDLDFRVYINTLGQREVELKPVVTSYPGGNNVAVQKHRYPYTPDDGYDAPIALGSVYTLLPASSVFTDKELSLKANNLSIKMKLENNIITLTTNSIKKGNLTDFKLDYANLLSPASFIDIGTISEFKGFESFEILPTHIPATNDSLISLEEISHPGRPGSIPGVVVNIKRPRQVDTDTNRFQYMDAAAASNVRVALVLWPQFTIQGSQTNATGVNNLHLQFNLGNNALIDGLGKQTVTTDSGDDKDTVKVYVSREVSSDNVLQAQHIVSWDRLSESMLVGGNAEVSLAGKALQTPGVISPDSIGYTYLQYLPTKTGEQEVELAILPYNINIPVRYKIYERRIIDPLNPDSGWRLVQQYMAPARDGAQNNIYVTISRAVNQQYKIEAVLDENAAPLKSQILYVNPDDIEEKPPVSPIVKVDNIYVVPGDENPNSPNKPQPQAIGFDIEWRAPKTTELEAKMARGELYYELLLRSTNNPEEVPQLIKVFKTQAVANSGIEIIPYAGTAGGDLKKGVHYIADGTFFMPKVALKKDKELEEGVWSWERIIMPGDYLNSNNTNGYPKKEESEDPYKLRVEDTLNHIVPGTYYLSMRTIFDPKGGAALLVGDESNLMAISLDEIRQVIPTPDTISSSKNTTLQNKVAQDIFFNSPNITKYVDNMLEPANWHLYDESNKTETMYSGDYEIFLYQERPNNGTQRSFTETDFNAALQDRGFIELAGDIDLVASLENSDLAALREGKIIPIRLSNQPMQGQGTVKFTAANLDPNQVYNVQVRVALEAWKRPNKTKIERSVLSKIHSFTTDTKPVPPTPDDKVPPAPKDFFIKEQPNNTTVVLGWEKADFMQEAGSKEPYHEIIRITDKQLLNTQLDNKKSIESLVGEGDNSYPIVGFKVADDDIYIKTYTKETGTWEEVSPRQNVTNPELKDITLAPNTIYYYYIRTVCEIDGSLVRSQWIMVPVTTNPVEAPIQLKVEPPSNYSYDAKTETVISFLAPVPRDVNIPNEYDFEIAVQGEADDDFRLDYSVTRLATKEDQSLMPEGYTHFVYRIIGLKPGKRYNIKVRVVDKTKTQASNNDYSRSLYSERVVARTEYDQDDQDRDNKFDEYLKKFDAEAEKLRRNAYWEAESDNRYGRTYKYREAYINAELAVRNLYELQTDKDITRLTYYFPASMFSKTNDLNVVITAALDNESISLRPYTLTSDNDAIKEAVSKVNQKKIKDYYIKLDFYKMAAVSANINGEAFLSPEICIDMELVYLDSQDMIIEDDIMVELNKLIEIERKDIITQLERELTRGTIDEAKLKDIIDDAISGIKKDHQKRVRSILRSERNGTASINTIDKPILLVSILDSFSVNGYYLEGSWTSVEVIQANGGFGIEAQKLGIYAFTGQVGIGGRVPEIAMYQNIISKYHLTDFFALDSYMIKTATTKKQLYGAVARILGAKRNTDYTEYLKSKGIKGITSIGMNNNIRQDEAIYIIMQAYEIIYRKPIASIQIKNRQSVTNIGAFQAQHRVYVYAAVELKIIQNPNAQVLPSKAMSVEETLKMLSNIVPK